MSSKGGMKKMAALLIKESGFRLAGRAQILLSAVCFGTIGTFAKLAYASGIDSPMLLALRFLVAAAALWLYFLIFNRASIRIKATELLTCAALGLAGYGIFSSLVFKALETAPASVVGLLWFSYPIFVIFLHWIVSRERPDAQLWIGASMILCGISVGVVGSLAGGFSLGILLAVGGAAWYAAYMVATQRLLNNLKPQTVALYVTTFTACGFFIMGGRVIGRLHLMTGHAWLIVLAIALISTVVALLAFYSGLEKLGSTEASQLGTFDLIVSLGLATLALGEPISLPVLLGATFIMAGMLTGQIKSPPQAEKCPDDLGC